MRSQVATAITPEFCAREVMETVPLVMRFIRTETRSLRAPSLSIAQFRVLTFLSRTPGAPYLPSLSTWGLSGRLLRPRSIVWCDASL